MRTGEDGTPRARTLLEAKIRERNLTLAEFAEYAETFARDNGEPGTISARHLQRLTAPSVGKPPPTPRPATRRLLERIFDTPFVELIGPPTTSASAGDDLDDWQQQANAVARLVATSARIDDETIALLSAQVDTTRRLDRQFGAATLLGALRLHTEHIEHLLTYATDARARRALATVLTDAHTLAGWQSLDRGEISNAWRHYGAACDAALITESAALRAHALAEQAVVLADIGRVDDGETMSNQARRIGHRGNALLRSWLAAAHGEALAAAGRRAGCLDAFDRAAAILPADCTPDTDGPYVALDSVHLARWRGHALARIGDPAAVPVLSGALSAHDAEFTRAEAALRVDLVLAYRAVEDNTSAGEQRQEALAVAQAVGSIRQRQRLLALDAYRPPRM